MKKTTFSLLAASSLFLASLPNLAFAETKTDIDITINQSLTLTLGKNTLELQAGQTLDTDYMTITGSTNSQAGFAISFNVNNPYNDLKHENATIRENIPSLTEDATESTFPETAWGYTLETENQTFKKLPLTSENIFSTEENGQGTYNFGLGAKVAADQAAGSYENELIFTIVANPILPKTISRITTMQEITPEICAASAEHETTQLKDTRDNKTYWVTKLKDGNCWMTQNLDYDLSTTITLTPEDSDVTANWTPSRATIAGAANISSYTNDNNTPYSFDPGNYYFDGTYFSSAICNYLTTTCDHFATTPYTLNGEHGHVGNYYNWSAAVASNDTSATTAAGTDINISICPKGWRLPHGYQSTQGNDFETLNTAYGGATNSDSVLLANPLFFVRGGHVYSGSLYNSAYYGYYWSSTAYSAAYADSLYFFSGSILPSYYYILHYNGFSVRCLAR